MTRRNSKTENGQSLILVALALVAFIALLALVMDGGYSYFMRRNAQNAADAGALAGARVYCETEDLTAGKTVAKNYVNDNDALVYPNDIHGAPPIYPRNHILNINREPLFAFFQGQRVCACGEQMLPFAKGQSPVQSSGSGLLPRISSIRSRTSGVSISTTLEDSRFSSTCFKLLAPVITLVI